MIQDLSLDIEIDNDYGWPKGVGRINCTDFSNLFIRTRAKTESDAFKFFLSSLIQKYQKAMIQSHIDHSKSGLMEIIRELKCLESILCNGGDFDTYRKEGHCYLYSFYRLYSETMELMIYFCEMREFASLLNQFYALDDDKIFDNQGIKKFYEMICEFIKIHHSQSKSSIFLKSWLILYRLIAKPKKDNLHKYVAKKIFRDVFLHLVANINELSFSAVFYHYIYHYWRDIFDEIKYSRHGIRNSDLTHTLVSEYKESLCYLSLIYSAYHKYESVVQFDFDPHYCAGEVALDLKLMKIEEVIKKPIVNSFYPEDEHKVQLVKDIGLGPVNLFFDFLCNKYTDDFVDFIQKKDILFF